REWGHGFIGTEHLLLALYREPEGLAAQILAGAGLSREDASAAVSARVERGAGGSDVPPVFTPKAIAVFSGALAAALELGHNYIGTEHLLLGLSRGDGVAADLLSDAGLDLETLTAMVTDKLIEYAQAKKPAKKGAKKP